MITFKSDRDLEKMRHAGRIVADILRLMKDMVKPGVDTYTLDLAAEALVMKENARPAFKVCSRRNNRRSAAAARYNA